MKTKTLLFLSCAVLLFLLPESWCAPKNKLTTRNWGPQSMLYLKGRHGRRFAPYHEDDYKQNLDFWIALLKSYVISSPYYRRRQTQNMDFTYPDQRTLKNLFDQ